MKRLTCVILGLFAGAVLGAGATTFGPMLLSHGQNAARPYAGQNARQISSLSADDIVQLEKGAGWGLAKPAELNGYPGPAHILELADKLELTQEQKSAVELAFDTMQANAKMLGGGLIEAEAKLDEAFESGSVDAEKLALLVSDAEQARAHLRVTHLASHLQVTPLLTDEQKTRYAELRGYGQGGHDGHTGH